MMVIALTLLLVALVFVLYRDRDFWFPDTQEAQDSQPEAAATTTAASQPAASVANNLRHWRRSSRSVIAP